MIRIEKLEKSFGKQIVLNNLDLNIESGKITVIIGKSGTGKSVLLKTIIGLMKPSSGKIIYDGKDIANMREKDLRKIRMKFGVLFQDAALFDSQNVFYNVAFPVIEHKMAKKKDIKNVVKNALGIVGLESVEEKMPSELSGGMRKRVGLARAIITKPDIVFFDEPTTGLDPIMSRSIGILIKDMQRKFSTTCFVISHDLNLTLSIADTIGVLYEGKIITFEDRDSFLNSDNKLVVDFLKAYQWEKNYER